MPRLHFRGNLSDAYPVRRRRLRNAGLPRCRPAAAAQRRAVRGRRPAPRHGERQDRARNQRPDGARRALHQHALAVPDLHHGQRLGHGDRPSPGRHRRVQQHHRCRLSGAERRRQPHALHRERPDPGRRRRSLLRRLREPGHDPEGRARRGLVDRDHRQAGARADLRSHRAHRPEDRLGRRPDRPRRRSFVRRAEAAPHCRTAAAAGADARRQRQGGQQHDTRHDDRQRRPAEILHRRRRQGGAADVQGAQQGVRDGLLVARSRRLAA